MVIGATSVRRIYVEQAILQLEHRRTAWQAALAQVHAWLVK